MEVRTSSAECLHESGKIHMQYQLLSMQKSGNGADFIMTVQEQPHFWQRLIAKRPDRVSFFGPRDHWITMEGMTVPPRVERALNALWNTNRPQSLERVDAAAWKTWEPAPHEQ
jgi:hypothetical protein